LLLLVRDVVGTIDSPGRQDHFDYYYREYDEFVFPLTVHPDVSGRPHVLLMHER
jgi:hypothetical protein